MASRKKGKKVDKAWLHAHLTDPYVKRAQREGYRARAAYKLAEIDESLRLVQRGSRIVDLGSTPGAWSQYLQRKLTHPGADGPRVHGTLIALDILPMEPLEGVHFLQGDFREQDVLDRLVAALGGQRVDLVLSDMAPNLTGIAATDSARVSDLVELAVEFAVDHLVPEGALLAKVFHGSGYSQLVQLFKDHFRQVRPIKPGASRSKSSETYLFGRGLRN